MEEAAEDVHVQNVCNSLNSGCAQSERGGLFLFIPDRISFLIFQPFFLYCICGKEAIKQQSLNVLILEFGDPRLLLSTYTPWCSFAELVVCFITLYCIWMTFICNGESIIKSLPHIHRKTAQHKYPLSSCCIHCFWRGLNNAACWPHQTKTSCKALRKTWSCVETSADLRSEENLVDFFSQVGILTVCVSIRCISTAECLYFVATLL